MAPKKPVKDEEEHRTVTISVEEFMRSRDAVVGSFERLKSSIDVLLHTYRQYTTNILKGGGIDVEFDPTFTNMLLHPTTSMGMNNVTPAPDKKKPGRKKVEKKIKDPNEPKRPQTAFLLFGQHVRPQIKAELGDVAGHFVEEEILKRYKELTGDEMDYWRQKYAENKIAYDQAMEQYTANKGHEGEAVATHDNDAMEIVEKPAANAAAGAVASPTSTESGSDASSSASDSDDEEPPPPPKAPSPPKDAAKFKTPKSKSKKAPKENGTASAASPELGHKNHRPSTSVEPTNSSLKEKSPEKRKKSSKEPESEEPKKKKSKKSKVEASDAVPSTPAVVDSSSHEKKKRKRKSEGAA